jgi:hypothetical protein
MLVSTWIISFFIVINYKDGLLNNLASCSKK